MRYPSELNTRMIRISLDDYNLLVSISRRHDITRAEALHELLNSLAKVSPELPMFEFQVKARPVFTDGHKITSNVRPTVEFQARAKGVIDGN